MKGIKTVAMPIVARLYLRVSTDAQDLKRQEGIITAATTPQAITLPASTARRHQGHEPTGPSYCA